MFAVPIAFGLAHDLAGALNSVTQEILCLEGEVGARQLDRQSLRQVLNNLKRTENRMAVCRNRLTSIATLFKQPGAHHERCCLNSVIDEAHEWHIPEFTDHAVVFEFGRNNRAKDDAMHADRLQLFQLIDNLVANASKALRAIPENKRRIKVCTFQPTERDLIGISVTDTAGSLLPEVQEHMYEPFFSTGYKGTGLGLWIVKTILDRVGVTPEVEVCAGVSTRFTILLPRQW